MALLVRNFEFAWISKEESSIFVLRRKDETDIHETTITYCILDASPRQKTKTILGSIDIH